MVPCQQPTVEKKVLITIIAAASSQLEDGGGGSLPLGMKLLGSMILAGKPMETFRRKLNCVSKSRKYQ